MAHAAPLLDNSLTSRRSLVGGDVSGQREYQDGGK